jgi:hypothetical protein
MSDCQEDADTRLRKRLHGIADHSIRVVIDNMVHEAAFDRQMRQPTLTDAEREAIAEAAGAYFDNDDDPECARLAATLHGLLERTK